MNEVGIKKTMLISAEQDRWIKAYGKYKRVSASQLFRLIIDELRSLQTDMNHTLKDDVQVTALKVNSFLSPMDFDKQVINDGQGTTITKWHGKKPIHNTWPYHNR